MGSVGDGKFSFLYYCWQIKLLNGNEYGPDSSK